MFIFASFVGSATRNERTWNISHSCAIYEFVHTGQQHQELKSLLTWMCRPIRPRATWKRKTRKLVKITRESPAPLFFFNVWSSGHWNRPSDEAHGFNASLFHFWRNLIVLVLHVIRQQNSPGSRWSSGCFHTPGILSTGMPGWHPSEAQVLDGFDGCWWWSWLPGSWDEVEMDFEGLINQHGYKDYKDYKDTMATCQFL